MSTPNFFQVDAYVAKKFGDHCSPLFCSVNTQVCFSTFQHRFKVIKILRLQLSVLLEKITRMLWSLDYNKAGVFIAPLSFQAPNHLQFTSLTVYIVLLCVPALPKRLPCQQQPPLFSIIRKTIIFSLKGKTKYVIA